MLAAGKHYWNQLMAGNRFVALFGFIDDDLF